MLDGLYWLLLWVLAIGAAMYMIFCVDPNDTGVMGKTRNFVFDTLPYYIDKVGVAIFGPKFSHYSGRAISYVFRENNCIVQV